MSRYQFLRAKNAMLLANLISNVIGVCVVFFLVRHTGPAPTPAISDVSLVIHLIFIPLAFLIPIVVTLIYERPIRRYMERVHGRDPVTDAEGLSARQRLLNEPFFLIGLDMIIWIVSATLYPVVFWVYGLDEGFIHLSFMRSLFTGLITTTIAFFVFEFVLQRRVIPHFFKGGGLYMTPGTWKIRIRTRLVAFLFACNLIPFLAVLNTMRFMSPSLGDPVNLLEQARTSVFVLALLFMWVGLWLTFLVSSNLTRPLEEIIRVLQEIRQGHFDTRVRVTSNDEIGYTGDVINEMTEGLMERDLIKDTFGKYVTEEIRDEILSGRVALDGEVKEVTVLFADLRDFTPMVEATPPREVVHIINSYFKEMDEAVRESNGLVLQYIGDEIEAVFGAPLPREDHPRMAAQASLEMRRRLADLNQDLTRRGYPILSHGIGIHTGEVLAANIGSPERLSYALVGDTVNLASRLQGLTKDFDTDIILSGATRERIGEGFRVRALPHTKLKGKSRTVSLFALP
jgi:adenylate cyclase